MTEVQNTATETLSAPLENPPIKELEWGDIDTLSVECVTKRLNRISVCYPCGGHRICKRCLVDWKVKLPQTYSYSKDEGVDWFDRVMEKVEVE